MSDAKLNFARRTHRGTEHTASWTPADFRGGPPPLTRFPVRRVCAPPSPPPRFYGVFLAESVNRTSQVDVHRTLLHRRNVIMCSVRGRWPPQVGSKLSIFQRQRYCFALNELSGSESFALVHEKVWSKVNWLFDQVNLYKSYKLSGRGIVAGVKPLGFLKAEGRPVTILEPTIEEGLWYTTQFI